MRDQVVHLAFGEELAALAAMDATAFKERLTDLIPVMHEAMDALHADAKRDRPADLLDRWRQARNATVSALRARQPGERIPWIGPELSAVSFGRARMMETFAHGQDIRDALGVALIPSPRLYHVAALGVRTRGFSYELRGLPKPEDPVRVELSIPDGTVWDWGPPDAKEKVSGPAEDFCLVVTRRRNPAGTRLRIEGEAAAEWMEIAQAYLGQPQPHRPLT